LFIVCVWSLPARRIRTGTLPNPGGPIAAHRDVFAAPLFYRNLSHCIESVAGVANAEMRRPTEISRWRCGFFIAHNLKMHKSAPNGSQKAE
jgi:hypothetical protein